MIIYDNEVFFNSYADLRLNDKGFNGKIEEPEMRKLIGKVNNLMVLDIGSGFGHQAIWLIQNGAKNVIAIDPSMRMIEYAKKEYNHPQIEYRHGYFEQQEFNCKFDVIVSSMAFHYIEDLKAVFIKCHKQMKDNGRLLFSIEHPIITAYPDGYSEDDNGKYWKLRNYFREEERVQHWFVDGVRKYHRTISSIVMDLINSGFKIEAMSEPQPVDKIYKQEEKDEDYFWLRPSILFIKAIKT